MAEDTDLESAIFENSEAPWPWPWTWIGHTAYRRASVIDLYLHNQISLKLEKLLCRRTITAGTPPSSRSRDTKSRTNIKNPTRPNLDIVDALVCWQITIGCYLPPPIVNGGGDRPWKVQFSESQKPCDLDLDLGSGHKAHRRASDIDLYIHTKFHWKEIGKTFCGRTDIRTDVPTDGHFRPPPSYLLCY